MPIVQPQYFTINQARYQHASLEIGFGIPGFGTPTLGLQSVDYDDSLEPGELRGTSPIVLATTTGKYACSLKLKLPKPETNFLVQQINTVAAANPDPNTGLVMGYGQWQWSATLNYYDVGQPLQTDLWYGCRIKKISDSSKAGSADPLYNEIELFLLALSRNGAFMVNPAQMSNVFGA